jgi:Na+-translocating ferredoxin:NAD+ oxidoreductase subunit C
MPWFTRANSASVNLWNWPIEPPPLDWLDSPPLPTADDTHEVPTATREQLSEWIDRLAASGVDAKRRTSPHLQAQLLQITRRPIDTVICSVLDVDPRACLNSTIAAHYPRELHAGVTLLTRITGAGQATIVLDDRVPAQWWTTLRPLAKQSGTRLIVLHNDYPQADPTLMLYTLLNRRLRPGRLPVEQGALLFDAAAAVAVGRLVLRGQKNDRLPLAIRDHVRGAAHYPVVDRGTPLTDLLRRYDIEMHRMLIRAGDVLRDMRVAADHRIDTGEHTFHASGLEAAINPDPCIRCGWCIDSCPTGVHPALVLEASQQDDAAMAQRAGIDACIDCGVCAYVCPSMLPLLVGIRTMNAPASLESAP